MATRPDPYVVIDRLEVGPVTVEPKRLVAPYRVFVGDREDQTELIYRYEKAVFEPGEPASENLAAMIAAQVALNYGLFCSQIVFHGPYDRHDRRLLEQMAANTAREIYVKKLLEPNPFLETEGWNLSEQSRDSFLNAELVFADPPANPGAAWPTDRRRHAILSSGGKESLLTHALLDDLGCETHPIFVNESGRHWFSALNAYRAFDRDVQNTARVWSNCDRLFSWMLRQLPFVREDFASVRSDEYPIRLWTVAVFLFGVLPLMRHRGIGRALIGDEFDTTSRAFHGKIAHYDGLYDQSRYFDERMTRYFLDKEFGIALFSILRPLSELLVEKILIERYPEIHKLQTSCHATHTEGDRVLPCGKCEKCRRVVAMLCALGADPGRIGYRPDQVEHCLRAIASKGVHQEDAGERQLMAMLVERGLLPRDAEATGRITPHPEVLKIRIDPERSPIDGIPVDLRRGLYQVFIEHTGGAVRRTGRKWLPTFPLDDPEFFNRYRFETPLHPARALDASARDHLLGELSWPEAERRFREVDVVLLPVGAIEQHGPHLTLDTDAFDADYLARRVAEACSNPKPLVLPLVPYGVSYHHDDFPGTISISNETLSRIVYDIGMSCARHGVKKFIVINGHGGNLPTLKYAAQMINRDANVFTCVDTGESSDVDLDRFCETENDVHAGEIETSTSLAIRPDLVDMTLAEAFVPQFSSRYLDFTTRRSVEWFARTARLSPHGVLGDPTRATAKKGEQMWQVMIANLVEFVEEIKGMTLDEIYERRY